MDSHRTASGLALIFLGLYWAGTLAALRVCHFPNYPLVWLLGMIPALLAARSFSALLDLSILLLPWLFLNESGFRESAVLYFPLMCAVAIYTVYRMESRALSVLIPSMLILWMALAVGPEFSGLTGWEYALIIVALPGLLLYMAGGWKRAGHFQTIDVILCTSSGNTGHYASRFIAGAENAGASINMHQFHHIRRFQPALDGDALVLAFPVFGWKPPWPLCQYLLLNLPRGNGKPAFILYTSAGGPENAGMVAWLLLTLKGYRVVGRNWAVYPVNVTTFRLGPSRLWKFLDRLVPREHEIAGVISSGRDFALGKRTGMPFILWPFPLVIAGFLLDNPLLDRVLCRNHVMKKRCIKCGLCVRYCPVERLRMEDFPRARGTCSLCLGCVNLCPRNAMHLWCFTEYGQQYHPRWPEFLKTVSKSNSDSHDSD